MTELALGTSDGDGSLWKLKYDYGELNANGVDVDANKNTGNIAKQTITFNGLTNPLVQTFKYDSLYRLTEAKEMSGSNQTWKENFSYDRYGNRTGLEKYVGTTLIVNNNKTHPTIDPNTNRFNSGQGYLYDKNGNIIQDVGDQNAVRTFVFNGENKQRFVVQAGKNVGEYFYDGEGNRVKKIVYDANGVTVKEETIFVYSAGKLVEEYSTKAPPPNPTTSYTATDQLGSPRVITNSLGEVVSRRDFMPFGEEITNNIGERVAESLKYGVADGVRQKFTGYQKDEETALDFAEARMYENRHGRFTAVDPLLASGKSANPQTFNRYVYCLNNPLIFTDPDGLQVASYAGKVYTNADQTQFHRKPFEGSSLFEGDSRYADADDGFTYVVSSGGYYSIGNTATIKERSSKIMADSLTRTNALIDSFSPTTFVSESYVNPPGWDEASRKPRGGRFTISEEGETDIDRWENEMDSDKVYGLLGATQNINLGGFRSPPNITPINRQSIVAFQSGELTINRSIYPGAEKTHLTVGTNSYKTDLIQNKGSDAIVRRVFNIPNINGTRKVTVPNLQGSVNFQQSQVKIGNVGRYNQVTNGCFSYTCNVLQAGGLSRTRSTWETTRIYIFGQ